MPALHLPALPSYAMDALPQGRHIHAQQATAMASQSHTCSSCRTHAHLRPLLDLVVLLAPTGARPHRRRHARQRPAPRRIADLPSFVAAVVLSFPSTPFLPAECGENTKDLTEDLFRQLMASLMALSEPLFSWCKAQSRAVMAIISDLFMGWTLPLAQELGMPHVAFLPASAHYLATTRSLWRRMPMGHDGDELPGSPSFPWHRLSWLFRMHVAGDEVSETIRRILMWSLESSCFVINHDFHFHCFEDAMAVKRVFMVGPLSEAAAVRGCGEPTEVAAWLDTFDDGSIVYISFWSQGALPPAQVACVANNLTLRPTIVAGGVRGGHGIGRFLAQYGRSSVMESAAAGVAMLTWPMNADQCTNAWLLEEAGVAIPVAEGVYAVPNAEKMVSTISTAVASEEARQAAAAVAPGGTSYNDLEELVCALSDVHVVSSCTVE
ncbi:hypothetical protein VPH35_140829 [Triticum aestivum]